MEKDFETTLQGLRQGKPDAFRACVDRFQRPLFRFLRGFGLPATVVEEVAQETFLRVFARIQTYDPARGSSFPSWLFVIARNLALHEIRRAAQFASYSTTSHQVSVQSSPGLGTVSSLVLHEALDRLDVEFRNAFLLFSVAGLSISEIATAENVAEGTVKSRIFRAKKRLQELLGEERSRR